MWCVPRLTPQFRERMDDVLTLDTEPLPAGEELHCFDETSKQLLGTPRGSRNPKAGKSRRIDYEYKRNGTRNIFVVVAPFAGTRTVSVTKRRTAQDTAQFLWRYCMEAHTSARRIHLILDNLNTHQEASLRMVFGEQKAARFFAHVVFHFTPSHASWLNMAELEINCLKTQGLRRRIPSEEEVKRVTDAIVAERNGRYATISWSFTKEKAREKFPALYTEN
jgi:hypothetical protein